jgi:riboflavin-specific deaminase-like protein
MVQLFPIAAPGASTAMTYAGLDYPDPPCDRPYVLLNFVITLDGQATLGKGGAAGIGSSTDHRLMRELRATVDGLLHGAGTVRAHNFAPVVPDSLVQGRVARGLAPQPLGAVVTRSGDLKAQSKYFSERPPLVFTVGTMAASVANSLGSHATVLGAGAMDVDLRSMLETMRRQFGLRTVLCEGGPLLAHGLLAAGCLDEMFVTLAPKIGSDRAAPRLVEGSAFPEGEFPLLDLVHVLAEGSELFLRYRVRR